MLLAYWRCTVVGTPAWLRRSAHNVARARFSAVVRRFIGVLPSEVASLYVLPERRGGGIGTTLLSAALDELRSHSAHATLWVFTDNHPARAFYAKSGFTPDGATQTDSGTGLEEIRLRVEL